MSETKIEMKLEEETKSLKKVCEKLEEVVKHQFDSGIEQIDTKEMSEVIDMWKDLCEAKEKIVKSCYYTYILKAMEKEEEEDEEYKKIMEKMRMSGDTEEDDMERRYYDNYRYKTTGLFAPRGKGSFMPRRGYIEPPYYHVMPDEAERSRDLDRLTMNKMYYPDEIQSGRSSNPSSNMSNNMGNNTRGYSDGYSDGYNEASRSNQRDSREGRSGRSRRGYVESKEVHRGNTDQDKNEKMRSLEEYLKDLSADVSELIGDMDASEKSMLKNRMQMLVQKIQ